MRYASSLVVLLVLVNFSLCWAQNDANGPSSITRSIQSDRNGHLLMATWEGVFQYDDGSFLNVTASQGLDTCHAFALLEDSQGILWIGTNGSGVYRYDGNSFSHYTVKQGLANDKVIYIYEDKSANIWFATEGGVSVWDGNVFRNFTTAEGLPNDDVNTMVEDNDGNMWIGTRDKAVLYDGNQFTIITNEAEKPFMNVRSIISDRNGNIWFGGKDGLWRYDGNSYTQFSSAFIGAIYQDKKGHIWTSTGASHHWTLDCYQAGLISMNVTPITIRPEKGMLFGIAEDAKGNIWFGTLNGVCRYDGKLIDCFQQEADN